MWIWWYLNWVLTASLCNDQGRSGYSRYGEIYVSTITYMTSSAICRYIWASETRWWRVFSAILKHDFPTYCPPTHQSSFSRQFSSLIAHSIAVQSFFSLSFFSFFPSFFPLSLMLLLCPSFTFNFIWKEAMCVNKILISPVATLKLGLVMRPSFQQVKCKCKVEILVKAVRKTIAFQIKRAQMRLRSLSLLLFGFTFPPIYNIDRVSLLPSWGQILRVMGQEKD